MKLRSPKVLRTYVKLLLLVAVVSFTIAPLVGGHAAAAGTNSPDGKNYSPGTCFYDGAGGINHNSCKNDDGLKNGMTDSNGQKVNLSKYCYEVSQVTGQVPPSWGIVRVGCGASATAVSVTCSNGSPAPDNETSNCGQTCKKGNGYCCGSDPAVQVSIDFGCKGKGNPILDMTFAVIRFLSVGVGLVIVGSMVWAGIQYTASRGEPQGTEEAIKRIRSNVTALVLFIFAYAILNYVVPGAVLK